MNAYFGVIGRIGVLDLPFGTGPRICIGSSFALQEATIVLAVLISNFDMRLLPHAEVWPVQRVTLRPANGLPMELQSKNCAMLASSSPGD